MKHVQAKVKVKTDISGWKFEYISDEFLKMTSYSREDISKIFHNNFLEMLTSEDVHFIKTDFINVLKKNKKSELDFKMHNLNEEYTWLNMQAEQVNENNIEYIELLFFETTRYHDYIDKLEHNLSTLKKSIPGGVCQVYYDEDFSVIWYNEYYLSMIGYTKNQFENEINSKGSRFTNPEDLAKINFMIQECIEKNEYDFTTEIEITCRNGQKKMLLTTFNYIAGDFGEIPTLFAVSIDITDYKQNIELNLKEDRYCIAFEQSSNCIWEYNVEEKLITGSDSINKFFGICGDIENVPESLINGGIVHPESSEVFYDIFKKIKDGTAQVEEVVQMRASNGEYIWVDIRQAAMFDENGKAVKAIALIEDITEKRRLDILYKEEEKRREAMTYNSSFACKLNITDNEIITVNEKEFPCIDMDKNYTASMLINKFAERFIHPDYSELYINTFKKEHIIEMYEKEVPEISLEYLVITTEKKFSWRKVVMHIIKEPAKGKIISYAYVKDIHDIKEKEIKLRKQAEQDSLTHLYNRLTVELEIEKHIHKQDNNCIQALYMLDLDNFKSINDMYGHNCGDDVLVKAAEKLTEVFGESAIIGRLGGDEFIIFETDCKSLQYGINKAQDVCMNIQKALGDICNVSASIGIAFAPKDGDCFRELYNCADMALYDAKRKGKNCTAVYSKDLSQYDVRSKKISVSREWLLDESNDMIYVSDFYNYELLYMNKGAKKLFNISSNEEYKGKKCYKVLQNKDKPCEFCTNHMLCREEFYTWEFKNENIGHYFILKDRIVDWYGVPARIEMASDITDKEKKYEHLKTQINVDKIIFECLREIHSNKSLKEALLSILEKVGKFYNADYAYLVLYKENATYEWKNDDFVNGTEILKKKNSENYFSIILGTNDQKIGLMHIENPKKYSDNKSVMESLSYYISEKVTNGDLLQRLDYLSYHDYLTGLLNRNKYIEYLNGVNIGNISSIGVAIADINELKEINLSHGYEYGDRVVKNTADLLKRHFEKANIFRLSGDEFLIIYENLERKKFVSYVQNSKNVFLDDEGRGVSIGFAWSDVDIDINLLVSHATQLMILEKNEHYRTTIYRGKRNYNKAHELIESIRSGNFKMFLQPKADCRTKKINGAEALVRFVSEEHGIIYPDKFIHVFEKEGTIKYIDLFIFEEVCKTLEKWSKNKQTLLPISLNFSRLTMLEPGLIDILNNIKSKYEIPKNMIEIEITETLGEIERDTIAEIGRNIKEAGFGLALDDFGSSYTNMAILTIVPADVLKLDRSLIRDLISSKNNRIILKYILEMCREMGVSTLAEGVETNEQFELLNDMKCESIQGYILNKPISLEEFEKQYIS